MYGRKIWEVLIFACPIMEALMNTLYWDLTIYASKRIVAAELPHAWKSLNRNNNDIFFFPKFFQV